MSLLRSLLRDCTGAVVIETAIIAPVLILASLGAFQISDIVARQHELQSGADQATAMVLAGWVDNDDNITKLKSIIRASLNIDASETVDAVRYYRCGQDDYTLDKADCATTDTISKFLKITLTDTYNPFWTKFGVSAPLKFKVQRMVEIG